LLAFAIRALRRECVFRQQRLAKRFVPLERPKA
jgi:hypothetical protein